MLRHSVALACALLLASAGTAAAADQSMSSTETLSVVSTTTLTGVPATLSYGSGLGGTLRQAPSFTLAASTNHPAGIEVTWAASNLANGGSTIAATARQVRVTNAGAAESPGGCMFIGFTSEWQDPGKPYSGPANTDMRLCNRTTAGSSSLDVVLGVNVPSEAVPGSYSGSVTFRAKEN